MTIIEVNKRMYTVPTEWNELSRSQLFDIMDCLFIRQYGADQGVLKLLKIITGMTYFRFYQVKAEELEEYFYLTRFLLEPRTNLTRQLIKEYDGLYGPSDNLDNIVMQELTYSDSYFMRWGEDRENTAILDSFVATLYRPAKRRYDFKKDPEGDPREPFNSNLCEWRAKNIIAKWPRNVKLAIAYWYDACRWQIVENNPEVFGEGGESPKYGMVSMMMNVAEDGVLGTFNDVEKQYVTIVLMKINESIVKAKAQERAMKA
jgi:hypothetical protein